MAIATLAVKLTADIAEFRSEFKEATKSANTFQKEFSGIVGKVGSLASGLVAGIGTIGLVNFVKDISNAASKTVDLSNKLGLSIEAVQRLSYVAGQTGTNVDAFGNAIFALGTKLAGDDKSAVAAVDKLGLAFHELRRLKPEQQFELIARALENVEDPQKRNTLALALFDSQARQILPAIAEGYGNIADQARIASDEQIKSLSKAERAWQGELTNLSTLATEVAGSIVIGWESARVTMNAFADSIRETNLRMPGLIGDVTRYNSVLQLTADTAAAAAEAQKLAFSRAPNITQPALGPAQTDPAAIQAISDQVKRQTDAWQKAQAAADKYAQSVKSLRDQLSGTALQGDVKKLSDAFDNFTPAQLASAAALERVGAAAEALRKRGATLTPQLVKQADASVQAAEGLEAIKASVTGLDTIIGDLADAFEQDLAQALRSISDEIDQANTRLDLFVELFDRDLAQAMASIRDEVSQADKFVESLGETFQETSRGIVGALSDVSTILTAIPGKFAEIASMAARAGQAIVENLAAGDTWGAVIAGATAAVGIVTKLWDKLGELGTKWKVLLTVLVPPIGILSWFSSAEEKVNDLRDTFLLGFGPGGLGANSGFHTLARQLHDLGAAGDQLFQRVINARKVDEFNAAMEAVNTALGRQSDRLASASSVLAEYGLTWEDAGDKFRNANLAAQFEVLFEKTQTLKEIGVDYNLILDKQSGAYSELLQAALRTGSEIPIAFRPILEDLLLAGKLLREDGTAFDDLADVSWSKTLTQGFKDVTTAIYDLRDALVGGVGVALDDLSRRRVTIPIGFDTGGGPQLALSSGSDASVNVSSSAVHAQGGGTTNVNMIVDGEVIARAAFKHGQGVLEGVGLG